MLEVVGKEWNRAKETYEQWNARIAPINVADAFKAADKSGTGWLFLNDYERKAIEAYRYERPFNCQLDKDSWREVCNLFIFNGSYFTIAYDRDSPFLRKLAC